MTRLLAEFPIGADVQVAKVETSDIQAWVSSYASTKQHSNRRFGYASHNLYVECIQAIFWLAAADKVIINSPANDVQRKKVVKLRVVMS